MLFPYLTPRDLLCRLSPLNTKCNIAVKHFIFGSLDMPSIHSLAKGSRKALLSNASSIINRYAIKPTSLTMVVRLLEKRVLYHFFSLVDFSALASVKLGFKPSLQTSTNTTTDVDQKYPISLSIMSFILGAKLPQNFEHLEDDYDDGEEESGDDGGEKTDAKCTVQSENFKSLFYLLSQKCPALKELCVRLPLGRALRNANGRMTYDSLYFLPTTLHSLDITLPVPDDDVLLAIDSEAFGLTEVMESLVNLEKLRLRLAGSGQFPVPLHLKSLSLKKLYIDNRMFTIEQMECPWLHTLVIEGAQEKRQNRFFWGNWYDDPSHEYMENDEVSYGTFDMLNITVRDGSRMSEEVNFYATDENEELEDHVMLWLLDPDDSKVLKSLCW
jgi:hypothetical protein